MTEAQTVATECSCEPSISSLDQSMAADLFSLSFQWKLSQNILNILSFYIYRVEVHDHWQCTLSAWLQERVQEPIKPHWRRPPNPPETVTPSSWG